MPKSSPINPAYLDLAGASAYLGGVSVRTLRRLLSRPDGLPHYRLAGKILIKIEDLDAYLERRRRAPIDLDALAKAALKAVRGA